MTGAAPGSLGMRHELHAPGPEEYRGFLQGLGRPPRAFTSCPHSCGWGSFDRQGWCAGHITPRGPSFFLFTFSFSLS